MARLTLPVAPTGLAVSALVGLNGATTDALVKAGKPVVPPVLGRGLLDTGTDVTAVSAGLLALLGIPVHSTTSTHTAGGQVSVRIYRVSLGITDPNSPPGAPSLTLPDLLVMELPASLPDLDVLIGLDVLLTCKLELDGPGRHFTLEF